MSFLSEFIFFVRRIHFDFGSWRRDEMAATGRNDILLARRGDDQLTYVLDRSGDSRDFFDGGRGHVTLRLEFTAEEWANQSLQDEVVSFIERLEDRPGKFHRFESFDLSVWRVEAAEVYIDGELYDPDAPDDVEVVDRSESTTDEVIELTDGGNKSVTTGSGDDIITLGAGDDTVVSGPGNDLITIGDGNDVVFSGEGDDTVIAGMGGGNDVIHMGLGFDTVMYPSSMTGIYVDLNAVDRSATAVNDSDPSITTVGDMLVRAGLAPDTPVGIAIGPDIGLDVLVNIEAVSATEFDDDITADDEANFIEGLAGNDTIDGRGGQDLLVGGDGNDEITGGLDADEVRGGSGNDTLDGGDGYDALVMDGNFDEFEITRLSNGYIRIDHVGGSGNEGTDEFIDFERILFDDRTLFDYQIPGRVIINGTANADILEGTLQPDWLKGFEGDDLLDGKGSGDILDGGAGDDILDGGPGFDTAWYSDDYLTNGISGIVANLDASEIIDGFGDTDTLISIEDVVGTIYDDVFNGTSADNSFTPFGGNDTINGGGGLDSMYHNSLLGENGGIHVLYDDVTVGSGVVLQDLVGDRDEFTSIEYQTGTNTNDVMIGGAGYQALRDNGGSDLMDGGAGYDLLEPNGEGNIYIDMFDLATAAQVEALFPTSGLAPEIVQRLQDTGGLEGFYFFDDGTGVPNLARGFEEFSMISGVNDTFIGNDENNIAGGWGGQDTLFGNGGNDSLSGGVGSDVVDGGSGDDEIYVGSGNDTVTGGTGNDYIVLGFENDQFNFAAGDGNDIIADWEVETDTLVLTGTSIVSLDQADADGDGVDDTIVNLSSGENITLLNALVLDQSQLLG